MAQKGKKRSKLARMARFFAVREQDGEAFGHAYNREMLTGDVSGYEKRGFLQRENP
jgi:hypothetical protein